MPRQEQSFWDLEVIWTEGVPVYVWILLSCRSCNCLDSVYISTNTFLLAWLIHHHYGTHPALKRSSSKVLRFWIIGTLENKTQLSTGVKATLEVQTLSSLPARWPLIPRLPWPSCQITVWFVSVLPSASVKVFGLKMFLPWHEYFIPTLSADCLGTDWRERIFQMDGSLLSQQYCICQRVKCI